MDIFTFFVLINILNVIIQTVKSLCTIKCGKWIASIVNAIAYGLYTVVLVYMNCELPLWQKILAVAGSNLIGVFVVKFIEEKTRKDKLWKIEFTTNNEKHDPKDIEQWMEFFSIPYKYDILGKHTAFSCYCATKEDSVIVKNAILIFEGKYFVTETKIL